MFAWFEKLFRSRRNVAAATATSPSPLSSVYSIVPPVWRVDAQQAVFRGLSGKPVGAVGNLQQALTLRDTLNLANGDRPTRRLLDAIYLEETALESNGQSHA